MVVDLSVIMMIQFIVRLRMAMFFAKGYAEVYSCPCGFVSFEGENSTITNRFRYSDQIITKFGNSLVFYNDIAN